MSTANTIADVRLDDGHGGEDHHDPHLAHHFDTPEQQFQSGKLGMWMFLATEILMFGGLFCAYAVYRHNHPEVFAWAHLALDRTWGAINTAVLIASSFTMAWAVRASQLGQQKLLKVLLATTILGGAGFMCIKGIEYHAKWKHGLWIGRSDNVYSSEFDKQTHPNVEPGHIVPGEIHLGHEPGEAAGRAEHAAGAAAAGQATPAAKVGEAPVIPDAPADPNAGTPDAAKIRPRFEPVDGLAPVAAHAQKEHLTFDDLTPLDQKRVFTFYQIYFCMTGLHAIHVLVGMSLILWILIRATRGEFGPKYFAPVDIVGLYWHLVDLIWIFLFPLLYLIN